MPLKLCLCGSCPLPHRPGPLCGACSPVPRSCPCAVSSLPASIPLLALLSPLSPLTRSVIRNKAVLTGSTLSFGGEAAPQTIWDLHPLRLWGLRPVPAPRTKSQENIQSAAEGRLPLGMRQRKRNPLSRFPLQPQKRQKRFISQPGACGGGSENSGAFFLLVCLPEPVSHPMATGLCSATRAPQRDRQDRGRDVGDAQHWSRLASGREDPALKPSCCPGGPVICCQRRCLSPALRAQPRCTGGSRTLPGLWQGRERGAALPLPAWCMEASEWHIRAFKIH